MSTVKHNRKEVFTAIGTVRLVDGRKRFVPDSPIYFNQCIEAEAIGRRLAATFSDHMPTRSESQLAYHWVLVGYLARYLKVQKEQMHDMLMKAVFGVQKVEFAGKVFECRRSIASSARMPKSDAVELIDYDIKMIQRFKIDVPTAEELGYSLIK